MNSIDVLISTYGERINNILPKLKEVDGVNYLIGHQGSDVYSVDLSNFSKNISYFPLTSKGVTLSRNFLITKATSDVIYFCDDDIEFIPDSLIKLINLHAKKDEDIIITSVLNEDYVPRKNYPLKAIKLKKMQLFSIGTVEISAKRTSIQSLGIKFCEDMGAGNKQFPIGDEAVFLADALDSGLSIVTHPLSIVVHAQESSGNVIANNTLNAIGLSIKRVYKRQSMISLIILLGYSIRFLLRNGCFKLSAWRKIKQVLNGYKYK